MPANRTDSEEGVVLRGVREVVEEAAKKLGRPWPELDEPTFESVSENAPGYVTPSLIGLLYLAAFIAGARGYREVLATVVVMVTAAVIRLARRSPKKPTARGKDVYDLRTKRRTKGKKPG